MGKKVFRPSSRRLADDAAAASADAHVHAAGLNHEGQLIAESTATAMYFKMNNHPVVV
jgi:hypothetical protein